MPPNRGPTRGPDRSGPGPGPRSPDRGPSSAPTIGRSEGPGRASGLRRTASGSYSPPKRGQNSDFPMPSTPIATPAPAEVGPSSLLGEQAGPAGVEEPVPLALVGFECSLATASLDRLEANSRTLTPEWLAERFERFRATEEVALVGTCCRQELLVLSRDGEDLERWRGSLPDAGEGWSVRAGREVVDHFFRVAGGQESIAVGEKEVRLQVRAASRSTLSRHRCRLLRDLLTDAADTADRAMPEVPASRSIAALAATRVLELTGRPFPRVLVIGSGAVGRQVTELLSSSARVTLAYRQTPPDEEFLRLSGARAVRGADLAGEIALSDAVVTAARNEERCLRAADFPAERPIVVVDLGVPRNVEPETRTLPYVRLVDLADLRPSGRAFAEPIAERALAEEAERWFDRFERASLEPWIAAARRHAETVRASELATARAFLGPLTPEQEVAVDRLTRRLVDRILLGPTERLRTIPAGEAGDRFRRFALELLRPRPPPP